MKYKRTLEVNPKEADTLRQALCLYLDDLQIKIEQSKHVQDRADLKRHKNKVLNMLGIIEDIVDEVDGDLTEAGRIPEELTEQSVT